MGFLFATLSSFMWGTSDFLGGKYTRIHGALRVLIGSQLTALFLMWSLVLILSLRYDLIIDTKTVLTGAIGGVGSVTALMAFYRALAIGPMAVVPPIAATGVIIPVTIGLLRGDPPTKLLIIGLVVTITGIVLASIGDGKEQVEGEPATSITPQTLGLSLIAAAGFALVFVALDSASAGITTQAPVATASVRLGSIITLLLTIGITRTDVVSGMRVKHLLTFAMIGCFDTAANLFFALATTLGALEVVAVLGSLYPAVTSALAAIVLRERLSMVQFAGICCALAGMVLLAL